MRGAFVDQGGLFSYIAPEARVPANHPLRVVRFVIFQWVTGRFDNLLTLQPRVCSPSRLSHVAARPLVSLPSALPASRRWSALRV
jgi:hypothetical protein